MRRSVVSLLLAVVLLFAFTAGILAEQTAAIVVLPETETFTISVPVAAGDRTVSGAQIYFKLSDNLQLENVELENVTKGFSIVKDDDTAGFFYMSTKTYTGNDGKYLLTFKFTNDQPGEIIFTERKYVTDLGAGKVDTVKEQEYLKVTVHREEPTSSAPTSSAPTSSAPTPSAPASSNATTSRPATSSNITSAPVSSNTVTSQPSASGTTSTPDRFEVQLPEQTRPASSEPAAPTSSEPAGSEPSGTPSGSDPTASNPTVSDPTIGPGAPSDEKPTSWWIVVAVIAVLAAAGGGFWIGARKKKD